MKKEMHASNASGIPNIVMAVSSSYGNFIPQLKLKLTLEISFPRFEISFVWTDKVTKS